MTHQEKIFWEMGRKLKEEFYEFQNFNNFLESHPNTAHDDICSSYLKILWETNFDQNKFSYSELDFAIKQVMEESWVAVNKILEFIELKYQDKTKILTLLLIKNLRVSESQIKDKKLADYILKNKKWSFQIWIPKHWSLCIHYDFTHQNFLYALDLLKKNIETELVRLAWEEKSA
jgi:hypothetical protein